MRTTESAPILVRIAAIALMCLALAVLAGWIYQIEALKRVLPGANSMKINTALGFLLAGVALWFSASTRTDAIARATRLGAPLLVGLLGALALFQYATGINLGIDELFFLDRSEYNVGAPGRMSVITAIAYLLFTAAMLTPRRRSTEVNRAFLALASAGLLIGALAVIGYMYGLPLLYRPFPQSSIAVHTASGLVIMFAGVFATRPDIGRLELLRSRGIAGVFSRQVFPAIILVPLALGWIALMIQDAGWVNGRTALAVFVLAVIATLSIGVGRAGRALSDMEATLRRREEIYKSITTNALDAFILADTDGRIIDWNPQAEKMYGWTKDEVLGSIVRERIMPPETRAGHAAGLEQFRKTGSYEFFERRVEVESVRRDESRFRAELIAIPMKLSEELFFALFIRDVTDQRKAEEQLRQAQKMEAVGQLTGGIAHDFNNTLTAIISTLDGALPRADPPMRQRIEIALNAAERAATMIRQLLAFSRKQKLSPARLDLNEAVKHAADVLRPTLGEQVQISLLLDPDLPAALADRGQVDSAILNLSINARDAMASGGRLTIETALAELDQTYAEQNPGVAAGRYVMIAVSDTGTGMSAETIEHAFEPFFSTKGAHAGTGLGLSMVHGFAKQSGGHVRIYSELGHGTTVRLYLPLADAETGGAALADPAAPAQRGGHEIILLVEDNPLVRTTGVSALKDLGYAVLEASDGREAMAVIQSGTPIDLLFTDIVMPGITGLQLAEQARRDRPGLRVLFTSGYTDNAVAQHQGLDAATPFLSKPYRIRDLAARIRAALDTAAPSTAPGERAAG